MSHRPLTEPWWTPWPGAGPGRDLLGDIAGLTIAELGCGNGDNAAAFAYSGATVTGIDRNPAKTDQARRRWPNVPRLEFEQTDASGYLATLTEPVDIVGSIFGALSFNPTGPLAGIIATRLKPGGRLALAARTPPARPAAEPVPAWATHARSPDTWHDLATRGLRTTRTDVLGHPIDPNAPSCIILVATQVGPPATPVRCLSRSAKRETGNCTRGANTRAL